MIKKQRSFFEKNFKGSFPNLRKTIIKKELNNRIIKYAKKIFYTDGYKASIQDCRSGN